MHTKGPMSILRTAIHTAVEALHHADYGDVETYLWGIDEQVANLESQNAALLEALERLEPKLKCNHCPDIIGGYLCANCQARKAIRKAKEK